MNTINSPLPAPRQYRWYAVITALLCLQLVTPATAQAEITTMGEAINIAGRQRMLSQRIAQSFLLIGLQPDSERGRTQLDRCVNEFESNLHDLAAYAPGNPILADLKTVQALWVPYRSLATGDITKANGELLMEQSNRILAAAHAYVNKLEKLSGTSKAELINISGRQRMLSQRIAKNFLARQWGINTQMSNEALYADLAEFENMLDLLMNSPINTPEINTQLNKVKGHFSYASKGFDGIMELSEQRLIFVVTGTTDYMLRGMDITTRLYADLLQ